MPVEPQILSKPKTLVKSLSQGKDVCVVKQPDQQNYSSIYEQLLNKLSLTKEYSKLFDTIPDDLELDDSECFKTFRMSTAKPNERYSRSFAKDEILSVSKAQDV